MMILIGACSYFLGLPSLMFYLILRGDFKFEIYRLVKRNSRR
jgi:hypothetical protein